jgi:hypothetical protein
MFFNIRQIYFLCPLVCRCVGKKWLFWFFNVGLFVRKNQICHLRVGYLFTLTHNGAEICEVLKISERSEEKFSEFCKSLVARSAEAKRRHKSNKRCNLRPVAPQCRA